MKTTPLGLFFYHCLPFRKKIVLSNMRLVFGNTRSERGIQQLAKQFYSHISKALIENLSMKFMSRSAIQKQVELRGVEHMLTAAEQGKGIAVLAGHFGNWEFAPIGGILNFDQYQGRFYVVRKTLKIKWLEQWLFRRYIKAGLRVIPKKNSLNKIFDALKKKDAVIFIMDQHASIESRDGVPVEFFGKLAGTFRSLAMVVRASGAPVVPMSCYRKPEGGHVLEFHPPLSWAHHDDARQELLLNTRRYNEVLEHMVLAHPEQWLWFHRRWKLTI